MKPAPRLLDGDDFSAKLLASALDDRPSTATRRSVAAALGVAASGPGSTLATVGTAQASAVTPPSLAVKSLGAAALSKSFVTSFFVTAVGASSLVAVSEVTQESEALPVVVSKASRPFETAVPSLRQSAGVVPVGSGQGLTGPPVHQAEPETPPSRALRFPRPLAGQAGREPTRALKADPVSRPVEPLSVSQEIALLDPVKLALSEGDASAALAALAAAQPKVRLLAREASLLRVEALVLIGRRKEALRVAEPLLQSHPKGPHAGRIRQLLGGEAAR